MRIGRTLIVTCALAVSAGMMCGTHGIAAAQEQRVDHITAATADNAVDEPIPSTLIGVGGGKDTQEGTTSMDSSGVTDSSGVGDSPESASADNPQDVGPQDSAPDTRPQGATPRSAPPAARVDGFVTHNQKPRSVELDYWAPVDG